MRRARGGTFSSSGSTGGSLIELQLEMEADSPELDRATVAIVGRIANVLKIRAQLNLQRIFLKNLRAVVEGPRQLRPVVQLQDLLVAIVEPAITQQKSRATRRQIFPVGI